VKSLLNAANKIGVTRRVRMMLAESDENFMTELTIIPIKINTSVRVKKKNLEVSSLDLLRTPIPRRNFRSTSQISENILFGK
jgi:hypothetical protein